MKPAVYLFLLLAQAPTFDVASIKPHHDPGGAGPRQMHSSYTPTGVDLGGRPLAFIISEAYSLPPNRIQPSPRVKNLIQDRLREPYDVVAKTDHAVSKDELHLMLQSLLTERFQMEMHRETKTTPVYKLVPAKDGPKLAQADGGDLVMANGPEGYVYRNAEVFRLASHLSSFLDRMVVDETGLKGLFNFTIKIPEELRLNPMQKSDGQSPNAPPPSVFNDVLKHLGLQLTAAAAPVEFLVIDRIEKLTAN